MAESGDKKTPRFDRTDKIEERSQKSYIPEDPPRDIGKGSKEREKPDNPNKGDESKN